MEKQINKRGPLAGIIPIAGRENCLGLPWQDCLQPLSYGCTAIERSVYECAQVGCDSIWIICNDASSPLIKERIGDYVLNPSIYESIHFKKYPSNSKKYIPVFYVPVLQKDRGRKDTLGWSVIHGALTSFVVSSKISKWVQPSNYYVSFPYGIYDASSMKKHRSDIKNGKTLYAEYCGKTVRDNMYLPFTFTPDQWKKFRDLLNENNTGGSKELPIHERWSARNFTLDKIFKHDNIGIDKKIEIKEYYTLDSWQSLKDFYKSDLDIKKMPSSMAPPFKV